MTTYAKRKLKYSRNENFNLLHYVEWDRFVTLAGSKSGLRVTLSYLGSMMSPDLKKYDLQQAAELNSTRNVKASDVNFH
jgi:hypothetical protein